MILLKKILENFVYLLLHLMNYLIIQINNYEIIKNLLCLNQVGLVMFVTVMVVIRL